MLGNPSRQPRDKPLNIETLCEGNSITAPKPRPKKLDVMIWVAGAAAWCALWYLLGIEIWRVVG